MDFPGFIDVWEEDRESGIVYHWSIEDVHNKRLDQGYDYESYRDAMEDAKLAGDQMLASGDISRLIGYVEVK